MKNSRRSAIISFVFIALAALNIAPVNSRESDRATLIPAAAHTGKHHAKACRARYRDCLSLKQLPSSECRTVYEDCIHNID
jgi:hypothetical protein